MLRAIRYGWHSFDAWTDATIDDPGAYPYGDPEHVNYVDQVLVQRVRRGLRRYIELNDREKMELLRLHLADGGSLRRFRDLYRPVPKREFEALLANRPDLWPLLRPEDRAAREEVLVEDLRLAG
jgi:hypothetical protein